LLIAVNTSIYAIEAFNARIARKREDNARVTRWSFAILA